MKLVLRNFYLLLFSLVLSGVDAVNAQVSNWSAVLPAKFPTNVSGQIHGISRISQMKFHPSNPNKMYAVSARGGLFISSDAGANWSVAPGTDFMPYARLASVCVDFTNDQVIYLGTGDHDYYYTGTGVWKSTNGGATFTQTSLNTKMIVDMIMDPSDHNVIVAITDGGVYKTINGGTTWVAKTATTIQFDDLKMKENTGTRTLFAATTGSELYRSTDFGETWIQITSGIYIPAGYTAGGGCRIALTPADSNVVYFAMVVKGGTIFKSTDGGSNFTAVKDVVPDYLTYYSNSSTSSTQGDYNFGIGADRTNANILYLVAHNVWKSIDGGVTWTQLTNWWLKVHTDMHQVIVNPYNASQLWNMNDGGVWLSTDGGNNWTPKSDGIFGYEIYHGNCSPTRKDMFSIGTQDNGELYANSTGWYCNRGGDWSPLCAFDYRTSSSVVYYYNKNMRRDVTGGEVTYGLPSNVTVLQDIAFHRSNPDLAFVGDSVVLRTTTLTAATPAWTQIASLGKTIKAMHCSFADPNRLYVITNDAKIYVSTDALSAVPTFTMYSLPNSTNTSASISSVKANPDILYITCNTRVYRSINNGSSWTNITYNLPSVNHVRVLTDEYNSTTETAFIASNNAVYTKTASQMSWTLFNTALPSRPTISDLCIFNDSTKNAMLRVSTYGRGMWETPISNLRPLAASFVADNTNPCPGGSVTFTDISNGNETGRTWSFPGGTPSTSSATNPVVTYAAGGTYSVTLTVTDGVSTNTLTRPAYITTSGQVLPLAESFENSVFPSTGWVNQDALGDSKTWKRTTAASGFGSGTASVYYDNYNQNAGGSRDQLLTPRLDLSGFQNAKLSFDVAYQMYNTSATYRDSLAVLVSTDCGVNFNMVYVKSDVTLATVPGTGGLFTPTASQWRKDTIDLTPYVGNSGIIISFMNIGRYGNNIYLDNINLTGGYATISLSLKALVEGFYLGGGLMTAVVDPSGHPTLCDTVTVELNGPVSPYPLLLSQKKLMQTDGSISLTCPGSLSNTSNYIVLKHRNALETWSAAPVSFNAATVSYDFTTAVSKAYGNNLKDLSGKFCLYSGDVNRDGLIQTTDFNEIENSSQFFLVGYTSDDLTGDNLVESADYSLIETNSQLFIFTSRP